MINEMDGQINAVVRECGEINRSKGWENLDRRPAEIHALIHSEVSEALEEVRQDKPYLYQNHGDKVVTESDTEWDYSSYVKVEGEAVELVDAVIRIMSYYESRGWDFEKVLRLKMNYNRTRHHLHGGKTL